MNISARFCLLFVGALIEILVIGNSQIYAGDSIAVIRGAVVDANGSPLPKVRVDIARAFPKSGPGYCPTCYLDCAKSSRSDADGKFAIESLDSNLQFEVLFTCPGYQSFLAPKFDPQAGALDARLVALPVNPDKRFLIDGKVDSQAGQSIEGALVSVTSLQLASGKHVYPDKLPSPVVTDSDGHFQVMASEIFMSASVEVTAPGFAGAVAHDLVPAKQNQIVVQFGASVEGRLVLRGKAVSDVEIALAQTNRNSRRFPFLNAIYAKTDLQGRFKLENLPPEQEYCVYSIIGDRQQPLEYVIDTKLFDMPSSLKGINLGDLPLKPSCTLTCKLEFEDGKDHTDQVHVWLNRQPAWDTIFLTKKQDSGLQLPGLANEVYEMRVASSEWVLDEKKIEGLINNPNSLRFVLKPDSDPITIPLKKKPAQSIASKGPSMLITGKIVDSVGNLVPHIEIVAFDAAGENSVSKIYDPQGASKLKGTFSVDLPDQGWLKVYRDLGPGTGPVNSKLFLGMMRPHNAGEVNVVLDEKYIWAPEKMKTKTN